jgi:hypothetical protein
MRFQKINAGGVVRADGVSIQIKHHDYLEYKNSTGLAKVSMDYDPETREINVYGSQVDVWETQNGMENIPLPVREKITLDLKEGLTLLTGKFVVT